MLKWSPYKPTVAGYYWARRGEVMMPRDTIVHITGEQPFLEVSEEMGSECRPIDFTIGVTHWCRIPEPEGD